MDLANCFLIDAVAENEEAVANMIIVNTTAINFLEFDASIYDYLDALSDANIEPYEHLQGIEEELLLNLSCH